MSEPLISRVFDGEELVHCANKASVEKDPRGTHRNHTKATSGSAATLQTVVRTRTNAAATTMIYRFTPLP